MQELKKYDTETKTILHYGNKIIEYCMNQSNCTECALFNYHCTNNCHFGGRPYAWQEVDLHE